MDKFWSVVWMCCAAVVISLIGTIGGCTAYESKLVADAIKGGSDPIDARCGITGSANSGGNICLLRAAKK